MKTNLERGISHNTHPGEILFEDIILTNKIYGLIKTGAFENPYHWEQRNNSHCKQDEAIRVFIKNTLK